MFSRIIGILCLTLVIAACDVINPPAPTLTPTLSFSAPTIAPSPTVFIQDSDALFGNQDAVGQNDLTAASLPSDGDLPPLVVTALAGGGGSVQLVLDDGFVLSGNLLQQGTDRLPGLLLVSGGIDAWGDIATTLHDDGYTVLVTDSAEGRPQVSDMRTLLVGLSELGTVDPSRMVVFGIGEGGDIAYAGCAINLICDATLIVNPTGSAALTESIATYAERPLFVIAPTQGEALLPLLSATNPNQIWIEIPSTVGLEVFQSQPNLVSDILSWLGQLW